MEVLLSDPQTGVRARASSTLQGNTKLYGASNALQDSSASWNSEGGNDDDDDDAQQHWWRIQFGRTVQPTAIGLQFQAGFAAEQGTVRVQTQAHGPWHVVDDAVVWHDVHEVQRLTLPATCPPCVALQLEWNDCTDFYGRLIVYQVQVWGQEVVDGNTTAHAAAVDQAVPTANTANEEPSQIDKGEGTTADDTTMDTNNSDSMTNTTNNNTTKEQVPPTRRVSQDNLQEVPDWVKNGRPAWGEKLMVPEWQDSGNYRARNGWKGRDLIHDPYSAVYIPEYFVQYGPGNANGLARGGAGTILTGWVYFSDRAESHAGYCHGGSMCSVMDDVIGWVAFLVTGKVLPWSGFTVQINCSLQKPIPVFATLKVEAQIVRLERRKVYVEAKLVDPANGDAQHAAAEGIVVLNRGVLPPLLESQASDISMG